MSERQNEKLSAFLDDEASTLELRQLLKDDVVDLQRLRRYQIASDAMHGQSPEQPILAAASIDISQNISQAIDSEQTYKQNRTLPWVGGAVAASLTVLVISISVFSPNSNVNTIVQQTENTQTLEQNDASATLAVLSAEETAHAQTVEYIPADVNMEFYLAAHNSHSSLSQPQTLGYARLASYSSH